MRGVQPRMAAGSKRFRPRRRAGMVRTAGLHALRFRSCRGHALMLKVPTLPVVMLTVFGVWQVVAGLGTLIPKFVHDRVPKQFIPVMEWFFKAFGAAEPDPDTVKLAAHVCQWIIGLTEIVIGATALGAAALPRKRLELANFSLGLATGLFGAFLLTMFIMHDKTLPAWNQYPSIAAWIGVVWLVTVAWEKGWTNKPG